VWGSNGSRAEFGRLALRGFGEVEKDNSREGKINAT
jgi:hypothetical protein